MLDSLRFTPERDMPDKITGQIDLNPLMTQIELDGRRAAVNEPLISMARRTGPAVAPHVPPLLGQAPQRLGFPEPMTLFVMPAIESIVRAIQAPAADRLHAIAVSAGVIQSLAGGGSLRFQGGLTVPASDCPSIAVSGGLSRAPRRRGRLRTSSYSWCSGSDRAFRLVISVRSKPSGRRRLRERLYHVAGCRPEGGGLPMGPESGQPRKPEPEPKPGDVINGRYLLLRRLRAGAMGVVFEAEDQRVESHRVAVKFIRRDKLDARRFQLFCDEVRTILRLEQVPGVFRVYDLELDDPEQPYLVTEFVDGWDLEQFMEIQGAEVDERIQIVADVCDILQAVHDADVLHRDIKPSNILIRRIRRGRWLSPVLVDFGLAIDRLSQTEEGPSNLGGTLPFMSPEQFERNCRLGRQSDVFALGVVLYWLLTDTYPYPIGDLFKRYERARRGRPQSQPYPAPNRARLAACEIDPDLERVVMRAIERERVKRYAMPEVFSRELRRWRDRSPAPRQVPVRVPTLARVFQDPDVLIGQTFDGHRILEPIGAGRAGMTYRARSQAEDTDIAFKLLFPPDGGDAELVTAIERMDTRLRSLRVDGVQRFLGWGRVEFADRSTFYLTQEWIHGPSVVRWAREKLDNQPQRRPSVAISLAYHIARALESLHEASTESWDAPYHGNLWVANVLVRQADGQPVLVDPLCHDLERLVEPVSIAEHAFGSRSHREPTTVFDKTAFCPIFSEPSLGARSVDIYGLGMTVNHLIHRWATPSDFGTYALDFAFMQTIGRDRLRQLHAVARESSGDTARFIHSVADLMTQSTTPPESPQENLLQEILFGGWAQPTSAETASRLGRALMTSATYASLHSDPAMRMRSAGDFATCMALAGLCNGVHIPGASDWLNEAQPPFDWISKEERP